MKFPNYSIVHEIILSGFSYPLYVNSLLFIILLLIYLFIITGNILLLFVIQKDSSLHAPMYFFIKALCIIEIVYTATIIPKMLANLIDAEKKMTLNSCIWQAYLSHALGASECYLLTLMSYDRYLAICTPLYYPSIMTTRLFIKLVAGCFITGFLSPTIETIWLCLLPFCGPNTIQNVFCDFPPLIALTCTDHALYVLVEFVISSLIILLSFTCVLLSYIRIIHVVLKIQSNEGRQKAFSTCGAHLLVVTLFFGSIGFMYIRPKRSYSQDYDKTVGLIYAVFIPLANPVIYGLRNKEIKRSLHKHLQYGRF
ncbi:olfactory receptor 6N2-like [Bombina bombina]|uniref:olfactory receptor 6N2-like n=1 Tax=Bombina bombina TaxID=8345 RepID=UPI00235B04CE|nr:olfactory receptor 6N2-like [Bombina bombina]